MKVRVAAACVGVLSAVCAPSAGAAAVDRDACAIPYEQAQRLRNQRIFSAAREQLEICQARCPGVLADDCSRWIAELAALTPTVTFSLRDAEGHPVPSFRVSVDGTLLAEESRRSAVPVDPGAHVFRFDAPGFRPQEVRATLNEGEHDRVVDVAVVPVADADTSATRAASVPGVPTSVVVGAGVSPSHAPLAYVVGATGLAALATGGALAIVGFEDRAHLGDTCSPRCSPGRVDAVSTVWTVAGITSAAGAVALAAGAVLWLRRAPRNGGARGAWWAPVMGFGGAGVTGEF